MRMTNWQWKDFYSLSLDELYSITATREEVFVVGQKCQYVDADGMDKKAMHLFSTDECGGVQAYLRAFGPGVKFAQASMGRVLTVDAIRGKGLGRALVNEGIERIYATFGKCPIKISAQAHLEKFYQDFGFKTVSGIYLDVNIPHLDMEKERP
jgi:ElaA protein